MRKMNEEFENVVEKTNENVVEQPTEEVVEGIELTDTANADESANAEPAEEKEEEKPQGRYVTDEELNSIVDKRVARKMSKLERDYESKYADYRDTEAVLNAGLGTTNIKEANERMREYYKEQGLNVPEPVKPGYSKRDIEILARAEANEIVEEGYEAMVEEANRLAQKGYANMNDREKIIFTTLGDKLSQKQDEDELLKLGAKKELLKDEDFISFRKQFNSNTPVKNVYELYTKNIEKKEYKTPGSMKNTNSGPKDFISEAEYDKMSRAEIRANMDLIEKSMPKW